MNDNLTIHDFPDDERPRERLLTKGADSLSTAELLAILLRTGTRSENAVRMAQRVLATIGDLHGLVRVSAAELLRINGLGEAKVAQILAAIELGKRINQLQPEERKTIRRAMDAARLVQDMGHLQQEQLRVILLDNSRRVLAVQTVYMGTVNASIIRIAEVFREAITRNSPAIIIAHNHPSGNPQPSPEDVDVTRSLIAAGELLDIHVMDHLIIGQQAWCSIREMGLAFRNRRSRVVDYPSEG